ncbi:MAG: hypothetical protein HY749_20300 [Gammaproteobacteria bacterium]|nr:hypothetical protein [Gammaproteobacteria bacterium]
MAGIDFDFDLELLKSAVRLVDDRLKNLEAAIARLEAPEVLFDEAEHVTGFGFVACQTFIATKISASALRGQGREALALGPRHRTGKPMVQIVNAAANYWKHSHQWSIDGPDAKASTTIEAIESLGISTTGPFPYATTNVLHEILAPRRARFLYLIPFLKQWRNALPRPAA